MKRICVFCGSSTGARPEFAQAARQLGLLLAQRDLELVYGGGNIGLMGIIADTVLQQKGRVIGVIPQALMDLEVGHNALTELRIVDSMHTRKAMMADLSDGFIALPGGYGTLEEFTEILTWSQLGLHNKPFGLLNVAGYYDHLLAFLNHAVTEKLLKPKHRALVLESPDPMRLLDQMASWKHPRLAPPVITPRET